MSSFSFEEATVSTVHAAIASGELTFVALTDYYLRRIEAYDQQGPTLNALVSVNPRAREIAAEMDAEFARTGIAGRSLLGIPVVLKDNYDTYDMRTTGAAEALSTSTPPDDAFVVARLRAAGALIIAKSNLTELALGGTTVSSLGGQTRNPYDLSRTPGGSSGGTGVAVAADFGLLGTGSDTGQSIRSPASANSLVGIRATRGLVSRDGIIPISFTQDEAGPIVRTVEDAARMLDVMAGYDPADPITAFGVGHVPNSYTDFLDINGLGGARIGLLEDLQGTAAVHEEVNAIVESSVEHMRRLGATVIPFRIPDFEAVSRDLTVQPFEFKVAFNRYLESLGSAAPVKSLAEFIASGGIYPPFRERYEQTQALQDPLNDPEYRDRLLRHNALRQAVMTAMADNELNAILYPHQQRLVVPIGEEQVERNGVLSNSTGFPALTFQGGFSAPTEAAPIGVPIGIELLGPAWSEPTLIRLAYAFEQDVQIRRRPASTPPLR
ncbi:MAG: amidase [Gammaproteobacteria bacterium]|nr:amidase [Gammaproteobacteria bacterium]